MRKQQGFTLIEMVVSIIILGVISLGLINFGLIGGSIYSDTRNRDQMLSEARFVLERIQRDIRNSVPMSLRTDANCAEFVPIVYAGKYNPAKLTIPTSDLPLSRQLTAAELANIKSKCTVSNATNCQVTIFPNDVSDIYNPGSSPDTQPLDIANIEADPELLPFTSPLNVSKQTASSRFYIYENNAVAYCVVGTSMYRYSNYGLNSNLSDVLSSGAGVLMATNVNPAKSGLDFGTSGLQQNGLLHIKLTLNRYGDEMEFYHNAHILNAQ
ncbi:MAG: type II secretion system protein [Aliivibrio sp.]|uniref:PulJ/GspJ family protein n=1 Tax=Aliivibrio sp. TaxID=1872443 RepID=UPI001A4D6E5D|nr:type II secretion system protein [Aliivibrio sp.]